MRGAAILHTSHDSGVCCLSGCLDSLYSVTARTRPREVPILTNRQTCYERHISQPCAVPHATSPSLQDVLGSEGRSEVILVCTPRSCGGPNNCKRILCCEANQLIPHFCINTQLITTVELCVVDSHRRCNTATRSGFRVDVLGLGSQTGNARHHRFSHPQH